MKKTLLLFSFLLLAVSMLLFNQSGQASVQASKVYLPIIMKPMPPKYIIVNHTNINLSSIPSVYVDSAKQNIIWAYGSTSHGTQIWEGADYISLNISYPAFRFLKSSLKPPNQGNPIFLRMGYDPGWSWNASTFANQVRSHLNQAPGANAFMWSWCGELSLSSTDVQGYLNMMNQLEGEYPGVKFVYMTGHTDGGANPTLFANNQKIRDYVIANNKVLFDFADFEMYDPDGTYYQYATDGCTWCDAWCSSHPGSCPGISFECTHSKSPLCVVKAKAFWWLSARLAGWDGITK